MKRLSIVFLGSITAFFLFVFAQSSRQLAQPTPWSEMDTPWADSLMNKLSIEEKIGQLFMVAAYSNKKASHEQYLEKLVKKHHIGGLIFFKGGPVRQAMLTNKLQKKSRIPMMIGMDAEWGLAMRLDSTVKFPRQMMLGAIQNDTLIYDMGKEIALQCRRLGVHVNFAPVVDVNNNPNNPVINNRSFGENKWNVSRKGAAYMKGMQDNGVLANAKHFPGHGDTDTDSHLDLPVISHSRSRLDSIELVPFRYLIKNNLGSMMVAHLNIPALDSTPKLASTLSPKIVNGLLRNKLRFNGLTFTDALNMKGVSKYYEPGEADLISLLAGNDVLLFSEDVPKAIQRIKQALKKGKLKEEELDQHVYRILRAKEWLKLNKEEPIELKNLVKDLNPISSKVLNQELVSNALTLVNNYKNIIPLTNLKNKKVASLVIGNTKGNKFQRRMSQYAVVDHFAIQRVPSAKEMTDLVDTLSQYDVVIVGVMGTNYSPRKNFGVSQQTVRLVGRIQEKTDVIVSLFGNPYSLNKFSGKEKLSGLLVGYHDRPIVYDYAAQLIFGGINAQGKLPVSAGLGYPERTGISTTKSRLGYFLPEGMGLNSRSLNDIDKIIENGIQHKAFPGCQLLVAKSGNIILNKSYGFHTYDSLNPVKKDDVYDLASITKIAASTLSMMKLMDDGIINLDSSLKTYLAQLPDTSEYGDIIIRNMMTHQAGLEPWIPFYLKTTHKNKPSYKYYSSQKTNLHTTKVAENLYILDTYKDSLFNHILSTPLREKKEYKYSDLGYFFLKKIIEEKTKIPLDQYVDDTFYKSLGASLTHYKPLNYFDKNRIVPEEKDTVFRNQLIQGFVHDPASAMLGGVAGHAGMFSSANDLAKMVQMLLNNGQYGGMTYFKEETVKEFVSCQFCDDGNRRGVGFDKPVLDGGEGPSCSCVSPGSFGHTGFTGTIFWADPQHDLIYIFLSNRIYPNASNRKIIKMNIRTDIQQKIYESIVAEL